jgi:hypothetical protein
MQLGQHIVNRPMERVSECVLVGALEPVLDCVWTPSGRGLSCNWVERRSSASAAESAQDRTAESRRKVA